MAKKSKFSKKVEYNGIVFDSTLECQFALFIEDYCEYYYHPLRIWYDKNDESKHDKQNCPNWYEPDFLVRNLRTNTCQLIEIKDMRYRNHDDTKLKEFHAKNYIERKGHNWEYQIITEKDIVLPPSKWDLLEKARKTYASTARKNAMNKKHIRFSNTDLTYNSNRMPLIRHHMDLKENDYRHFIKTGVIRKKVPD